MISAVITNYKTWDLTLRCLHAIYQHPIIKEVVIVDDCSGNEIPEEILNNPLVKLIINSTNEGYASSVNTGFASASMDYVLLLDSDAYPLANLDLILEDFYKDPLLGILALRLVDENGNETGRFETEVNEWTLILGQQLYAKFGRYFENKTEKISVFSCGMAVRKIAFEEIGGFDTSFDFLDADHDFSMRMNKSLYHIAVNNDVIIFHVGGGSPQLTSKRVLRFYKSRFKLLRKHKTLNYPIFVKLLVSFRTLIELTSLCLIGGFKYNLRTFKDKLYSRWVLITHVYKY